MDHEPLQALLHHQVHDLGIAARRPEGARAEGLGLPTREQGRSVDAGEKPNLNRDGPDLIESPPIHPLPPVEDRLTDELPVHVVEELGDEGSDHGLLLLRVPGGHRCRGLGGQRLRHPLPRELGGSSPQLGQAGPHEVPHLAAHVQDLGGGHRRRPLGDRVLGNELLLERDQFPDDLVGGLDRLHHPLVRDLPQVAFHHRHCGPGPSNDDVHPPSLANIIGRVDDDPLLVHPQPHRGHRPGKRGGGDHERRRSAEEPHHVRWRIPLRREDGGHNVNLLPVSIGEQGADRAVDEARREHGVVGGPPLPLEEPAGDLPPRVEPLLEIHPEREVIELLGRRLADHRHEDLRVAPRREDRGIGLPGNGPALQPERLSPKHHLYLWHARHTPRMLSSWMSCAYRRGSVRRRYWSSRRRCPTILCNPRREWKSLR